MPEIGVQLMSDKGGEWMLPHWMRHFRAHNPDMPVTLIDYGCNRKKTEEFQSMGGKVLTCPTHIRSMRFETRSTAIKGMALYEITISCDLDVVVQGDLMPLVDKFLASGLSFGGCADLYYPWTWRPTVKDSTRHFPIMSGFLIYRQDSHVMRDWVEVVTTWKTAPRIDGMMVTQDGGKSWQPINVVTHISHNDNAFRDDMQALSQIYRIGHPEIWQMPAYTQWFRISGDDPAKYLVAHYTGSEGKTMLKAERGWR
jgi:hypothetical protein